MRSAGLTVEFHARVLDGDAVEAHGVVDSVTIDGLGMDGDVLGVARARTRPGRQRYGRGGIGPRCGVMMMLCASFADRTVEGERS